MAFRRVAFAGDSYARDLEYTWSVRYAREGSTAIRLFGGGGSRLRYADSSTFEDRHLANILSWGLIMSSSGWGATTSTRI